MNEREILELIRNTTLQKGFILTEHASDQAAIRKMRSPDISDILLNANRVIRNDIGKYGDNIYKIKGGAKNRSLAVCIAKNGTLIITVM
ncbi:MAG: hypothetical protein VR72_06795 [Clostridiaceae bacterium BRH_c20a]|nr:MAG: hypothetical protein VR72_06795 [Clostridiaceae bacterium BRH_c20a]